MDLSVPLLDAVHAFRQCRPEYTLVLNIAKVFKTILVRLCGWAARPLASREGFWKDCDGPDRKPTRSLGTHRWTDSTPLIKIEPHPSGWRDG